MENQLRLHYAPDNASLIIRLALYELEVPFETVLVDRATREQDSKAYRRLNPNGLIPVLETHQGPIFETGAILLWLVDKYASLGPDISSPQRGEFLKWLFFLSNTVHPELRQFFYPSIYVGDDQRAIHALRAQRAITLPVHLAKLDHQVGEQSFLLGSKMSVLDIYLCCMIRWMGLYPVGHTDWFDLATTSNLNNLAKKMECRGSVVQSIKVEGLGATPFSAPTLANPPEGTAT
ncbi:MAG: glutathione S-transferase family protein [Paracoccaceae bacterium]|nr:glutathione S-transferase family protein [Paracoccaceae bacterium]